MKLLLMFLFASISLISTAQPADSTSVNKPYLIKSCKIVYKFKLGFQTGTKTVIFDNWGRSLKEEMTTVTDTAAMQNAFGPVSERTGPVPLQQIRIPAVQHNLVIVNDSIQYSMDLDQHIGQKSFIPPPAFDPEVVKDQLKFIRTDTLLGKTCEIYEFFNSFNIWMWQKITVKKEALMPQDLTVIEYATQIDDKYVIQPGEFDIPAGIRFP